MEQSKHGGTAPDEDIRALYARLDDLSAQTNRSRNELINLLLEEALQNVTVIDED